jgi:hypothetical protein
LFGGEIESGGIAPLVAFDTKNQLWNVVNDKGTTPDRRRFSSSVCDDNARMYIFGGSTSPEMGMPLVFRNDFDILDTTKLVWSEGNKLNLPVPVDAHTATLLPNGRIVYIGGSTGLKVYKSMSEV